MNRIIYAVGVVGCLVGDGICRKSAVKLWSDEQKLHMRHMLVGEFVALNYSKLLTLK